MLLTLAGTFFAVGSLAFAAWRIEQTREELRQSRINELQDDQSRLAELYLATVRTLALAVDAKDQYTHQHILRVQRYAMAIADQMGLNGDERKALETRCSLPGTFALLSIDLDSFRALNENFGVFPADGVLREVSRVLLGALPEGTLLVRRSSDEFVALLERADRASAERAGEWIQASVRSHDPELVHYRLGALRLEVTVGVACFPDEGSDAVGLVGAVYSRLAESKNERKRFRRVA